MDLESRIKSILSEVKSPYSLLEKFYIPIDKEYVRRTKNLRLIPYEENRRGGKYAYAEWAHVIGIFQTLLFQNVVEKENNTILDVGCGTGLLGIASEPFLGENGKYLGIDVMKADVNFCKEHYPSDKYEFIHFDVNNPAYSPEQIHNKSSWPVESESIDIVTALSVWTHFKEEDALFYIKEVSRVLKKGSRAIITFFILDEVYDKSLDSRTDDEGRFSYLPQSRWIFDQPSYGSKFWFHPKWVKVPENAIGLTTQGLKRLTEESGMSVIEHYHGNWKEVPGLFFQDVVVFQKN